jgi:hypothetical protein
MTQQQQEEVNLLKELIADSSISADERMIYEDALSELMKSEKPKASTERKRLINDIKPQKTTERKPRTTTQRKPQAPKQSKSDIELAKAEIKRRTGKTEEECESIVNEYRSLRAKSVERKKKESVASAENKDRVAKLKKDDKIISGTSEKTADAVIESTTKDVAEKIVKEIDKIEQKAEIEATKEVKKEMPKESTTEQNKVIAEKTEEKVKAQTKTIVKRIVIDTSSLLTSIAESLGKFDKDSQKEFLIKLRSDIDKLLTKYSYGGSTMGATQTFNITQSNLSSSSVNPTMFGGGGGVGDFSKEVGKDLIQNYDMSASDVRNLLMDYYDEIKDMKRRGKNSSEVADNIAKLDGESYLEEEYDEDKFDDGGSVEETKENWNNASYGEKLKWLKTRTELYSIEKGDIFDMADVFARTQYHLLPNNVHRAITESQKFKRGGGVRIGSDGREYPYGSAWALEHNSNNKSENYEIPLSSRKKKRFDDGGGVNSGLNYGKKDDVFIEVITLLNSKLEKPTFMGKQTNTKQVMSLDSFMEFIKKYEYDERYEVNVPIELFTKESFNQYNSDNSKLKFITGSISLLGKEDLLKKYIRNKESLLSNRLTYKEIEKINDRTSIKNAPEKTTIVKRIVSKQLLKNGGGVGSFENNVDYINWQGDNYIEDGGLEMQEEMYSIIKKYIDFDTINGMVDFDDNINNSLSKSNNYDETIVTANLSFYKGKKLVAKLKSFTTYNESNDEGLTKETIFFDNDDFVNIQYTYGNTYTGFDPKRVYEKMLQNEIDSKKLKKGGNVNTGLSVEKGYMVFNYTDNLYANYDIFATKKEANNFIKEFRNRYKQQGYYRDSNMNKINVEDIDLEIIPSDFNPLKKFVGGGGVDEKEDYFFDEDDYENN